MALVRRRQHSHKPTASRSLTSTAGGEHKHVLQQLVRQVLYAARVKQGGDDEAGYMWPCGHYCAGVVAWWRRRPTTTAEQAHMSSELC